MGQHHAVITLDEKINAPAKEIQWKSYYELEDMIIRLGRFHGAINFMGIIDKRMKESSLETLTTNVMERRKHNYRDDRMHRITLEALGRLIFCSWNGLRTKNMIFSTKL